MSNFAGVSVITVGDFFQLTLVAGKPVYANYKNNWQNFNLLWKLFKIFKLTEVTRQRDDSQLIDLLNDIRTGDVQPDNINILKSRVIQPGVEDYPHNAVYVFAKNANADRHNDKMLDSKEKNFFSEKAIDNLRQYIAQDQMIKCLKNLKSNWGACRNPSHQIKWNSYANC